MEMRSLKKLKAIAESYLFLAAGSVTIQLQKSFSFKVDS